MEFQDPDIAKFLSDPVFVRLVKTGGEDRQWKEYEQANWERREAMAAARLILLASERFPGQTLEDERKQVLWNRIEENIEGREEGQLRSWRVFVSRYWWVAATLVLIAGSVLRMYRDTAAEGDAGAGVEVAQKSRFEEIVNDRKSVFPVDLPDGSTVLLASASRVSYDLHDFGTNGKREIHLSGEAFFEVVPNRESPFYIYTSGFTTKVLGTSFNVRAFPDDEQAEVVVRTGRVTVFAPGISGLKGTEQGGEIVNPDERIVLDRNKMQLSLEKLEKPEIPDEQLLHFFDDKPVSDIFDMLEKAYDIRIRYPDNLLSDCRITASFVNETLYEKIRLICKGLGATYKVVDGEIVIDSEGCT
ncbi:MAG: hypothetical protein ABS46_07075 [Cytophagaceae bacterium SCN 52-12]|nr:MAG: hypothetical protein ABS46_07075 [Cytophagaceae bacterium SCN 52-12]